MQADSEAICRALKEAEARAMAKIKARAIELRADKEFMKSLEEDVCQTTDMTKA